MADSRSARRPRLRGFRANAAAWFRAAALVFVAILLLGHYVQHRGWPFVLALVWAVTSPTAFLLGTAAVNWERRPGR